MAYEILSVLHSPYSATDTSREIILIEEVDDRYRISEDDYFTKTIPIQVRNIYNKIYVHVKPLVVGSNETLFTSTDVVLGAGLSITLFAKYSKTPATTVTLSIIDNANDIEITSSTIGAWKAIATIRNNEATEQTFKLQVDGTPLVVEDEEIVTAVDEDSVGNYGERILTISDNHLIQTREQGQALADALLSALKSQSPTVKLSWRGDPALELGDTPLIPQFRRLGFDLWGEYTIVKNKLTFENGLTGEIEGRLL